MDYKFKEARIRAGLTVTELGRRMEVSQAAASNWDLGKKVPAPETLCRLADFYGVSTDYLLGREPAHEAQRIPMCPAGIECSPTLHGKPVWDAKHGWGILNDIQGCVYWVDGSHTSIDELFNLQTIPPAYVVGYYGSAKPISKADLGNYQELWIQPISPDSFFREEAKGWYQVHEFYVQNSLGARFLFDTYGTKWLAFEMEF